MRGVTRPDDRYLITADMIKPGACVIDVGFRRIGPGRFAGDVDFDAVKKSPDGSRQIPAVPVR